jgi:hypothetical protein
MAISIQASIIANGQYSGSAPAPIYNPLLQDYPNASAAYSLRLLNPSYIGPAIEVRRDSDDDYSNIGFTQAGQLDIAGLFNFLGSANGYVSIWYDQSGNGRDVSQAEFAKQPRIVNSGQIENINGKPAVYFWIEPSWEIYSPLNTTWTQSTVAFVAKADNDISTLSVVVSTWNDFHGQLGIIRVQGSATDAYYRAASTVQNIGDMTYPDGSLYFNGNLVSAADKAVNYHMGFVNIGSSEFNINANRVIIGNSDTPDRTWDGYIQEIVIWETNYASSRSTIQNSINSYYNIY